MSERVEHGPDLVDLNPARSLVPDGVRARLAIRVQAAVSRYEEEVVNTGIAEGFRRIKALADLSCVCPEFVSEGRRLGVVRKVAAGWALVGWRGVKARLDNPEADAVAEVPFDFCPWCGRKVRTP